MLSAMGHDVSEIIKHRISSMLMSATAAIAATEEKANRQEDYNRIAAGLVERNAISDLRHIEEEASNYELHSLRNEVGRHDERQKALQAQTAEDALAKALPAIARYLRLRIAAEVLQGHGFVPRSTRDLS
jgi:hypothetical protein